MGTENLRNGDIILSPVEQMRANLDHKFWKGPDVITTRKSLLRPGVNDVRVLVTADNLPPLIGFPQPEEALQHCDVAGRSRIAQLGGTPHPELLEILARQIKPENQHRDGSIKNPFEARVPIYNFSPNEIAIPKFAGVFRLYTPIAARPIQGEDLVDQIMKGQIDPGRYGVDWEWMWKGVRRQIRDVTGLLLRIQPDTKRQYLKTDKPITIDYSGKDYRDQIKSYQSPFVETTAQTLTIAEVKIALGKNFEGVILPNLTPYAPGSLNTALGKEHRGIHIPSWLIDAGTDWRHRKDPLGKQEGVKVEIYSPTTEDLFPDAIPFQIWEARHAK